MGYQKKSYKKFVATAATATLVASAIVPVASASFSDVEETHEFATYINTAVEAGYIKGYADGTFGINDNLKRSQVVIIIGRYLEKLGYTSVATTSPWSDVKDAEVIKYGNIVKDAGVFTGYADGTLNGGGFITRENMAIVLDRLAKTVKGTSFADVAKEIDDVKINDLETANADYRDAIQALRDLGISTADNFNPKGNLKRGQFAKFIMNAVEKIDEIAQEAPAFAVESVKALNETAIEVTFGKDVTVTNEELKDVTITLKAGETTLTATYTASSLSDGKAVFNLAEGEKLVDATVYTLASEKLGFAVETLTAKTANAYAATFATDTTAITASLEEELKNNNTERVFKVTAKDQYGEAFTLGSADLSVEGSTINGMPLSSSEITIENDGTVKITRTLVEGDKLAVVVTNKDGNKVLGTSTIEFTVGKAAIAVPTKVAGVKATVNGAVPTTVVAGDVVTLTPDVRDQNNTVIPADVRYVVTAGKELLDTTGDLTSTTTSVDKAASGAVTFTAVKPGTVTIDVYNVKNGAKYTYTVEVGAKKLESITSPASVNGYNNEVLKTTKLTANEGAAFTADMIKFHITDANGNATSDVTVVAKVAEEASTSPSLEKGDIYLEVKTTKAGNYNVTPYVGESFTSAEVVKGQTMTITTELNPIATTIDTITVGDVKVGTPVTKEIVVRNKHNEDITKSVVDAGKVKFEVFKDGAKVNEADYFETLEVKQNATTKKYEVKYTAKEAGEVTVRVFVEGSVAAQSIAVKAEKTELASINLGQDIYDGVVSGDGAFYQIITAKDNKGDVILPANATNWTVTAKAGQAELSAAGGSVVYVKKNENGQWTEATATDAEAVALKVDTKTATDIHALTADKTVTYTVSTTVGNETVTDSINVKVKAQRKAHKVSVTPSSLNLGLGGTTTVKVNVVDQYGKAFAAQPTVTDNQAFNFGAVTESKKGNEVIVGQYEFTATAKDTGAQTIEVGLDGTAIKATVNVNVAPASELVQSIVISGEGVKEGKATVQLKHNTSNAIDLNVIGKDLNNAEVSVNQSEVIWTSSDESVATIAQDGKVTTKEITDGKDKEVTFTADLFGKKYEVKFTVSAKASQLATGTLAIANPSTVDGDKDVEGVQIVLGANNADANVGPIVTDGEIVITFTGVDQYGDVFAPAVISNSLNASIATAVATGDTVKITAVKAGETTVRVTVGAEEILIPVKVTQEAVDAAKGTTY